MKYCQATQHNPTGAHGGYGQGANRDSHRNGNYPHTNTQNKSSSRASGGQQQQTGYGHNNYNRDGLQDSKNHKLSPFKQNYVDSTKTREEENMGSNAGFKNLRHQDPLRPPPSMHGHGAQGVRYGQDEIWDEDFKQKKFDLGRIIERDLSHLSINELGEIDM